MKSNIRMPDAPPQTEAAVMRKHENSERASEEVRLCGLPRVSCTHRSLRIL